MSTPAMAAPPRSSPKSKAKFSNKISQMAAVAGLAPSVSPSTVSQQPPLQSQQQPQQPSPVSAQATIAQLQEKWSEALSSPSFQSIRVGQFLARGGGTPAAATEDNAKEVTVASPTSAQVAAQKAFARREAAKAAKQRAIQAHYGPAVEHIEHQVNQVVIDDAIMKDLKESMRMENAITNGMLRMTIHAKLLQTHREQIREQQELAKQLQAMNQANQVALMGKKGLQIETVPSPTSVTTVLKSGHAERTDQPPNVPLMADTDFSRTQLEV